MEQDGITGILLLIERALSLKPRPSTLTTYVVTQASPPQISFFCGFPERSLVQ